MPFHQLPAKLKAVAKIDYFYKQRSLLKPTNENSAIPPF
jgi:hypothetical protein